MLSGGKLGSILGMSTNEKLAKQVCAKLKPLIEDDTDVAISSVDEILEEIRHANNNPLALAVETELKKCHPAVSWHFKHESDSENHRLGALFA